MKKTLILLFVLALVTLAFADVIVGTGTINQNAPMSTLWNYYRSAALYTGAELSAGSGTITNLQWYCNTANTTTAIPTKIYLKTTTSTTLAADTWANQVSGATEVFNASIIANATGWFDFDITDTAYNAGDNVVVLIETGSTAYVSPYVQWRYTNTSPNRFITANSDGSAPTSLSTSANRPNIKFVGISASVYPEPTNHATGFAAGTVAYTTVQLNWTGSTGAQLPTGYLIQAIKGAGTYASVADRSPVANDAVWTDNNFAINVGPVVGANTYTFTGLTADTAYEFKIWPYTNSLTDIDFKTDGTIPTVNATTLSTTVTTFPFVENFDGVTAPALPPNFSVTEGSAGASQHWKTTTTDSHSATAPNSGANFAYINCYSATATYNPYSLISPPIALDAIAKRLSYYYWIGSATVAEPLFVDVSTDLTNWTTLYTHSNASNTLAWYNNIISLSAYASSTVYLRFRGVSNYGSGLCNIGIDDVVVENIPSSPTFSYSPNTLNFANVISGANSAWQNVTVSNTGAGTLILAAGDVTIIGTDAGAFSFDAANLTANLGTSESALIPVRFTAPGIGSYTATLRMSYEGTDYDVSLSGTGVAPFVNMSTGSTTLAEAETWNFYDSGGVSGQYASSENFSYTFNPPTGYRCIVQFSAFNTESSYDFLNIYDGTVATGTLIGNYSGTTIPPSYTAINSGILTFVFTSDGSGVRDGWAAAISSEELPAHATFSHSPTSLAFPATMVGTSSAAQTVTVTNIGGGTLSLRADDLRITGDNSADFSFDPSNLPAELESTQSVNIPVTFNPQSSGNKAATLIMTYDSVEYEVALSGYAYPADYVFEGFEGATFPPVGWANPNTWLSSTTAYAGTKSAYKYGSSSTPYILSTPKLNLDSGGNLAFMARIGSTTTALDIVYSTDRTTWTKLGASIFATTTNTWFPVLVDLSTIPAKAAAYYIGFRPMGSSSYYIDNVIMPPFAQEAPSAVTLTAPADALTNVGLLPTFSWIQAITGGVPTAYDIYLEATTLPLAVDADPSVLWAENVPASPYTPIVALNYSTTYIWKVVAKNVNGSASASAVRSFTTLADPTKPLPYSQDFNSGTSLATINWSGTMSISAAHGTGGSNGLNRNMWSSTATANGVTPPIGPMTAGVMLSFDYRIADFVYSGYPTTATTLGESDNIQIQISTNAGLSYSTIHTIDNSNHVVTTDFAPVTVDLSAYNSGSIMLKFLCTWGAGDYYVDIDNVVVRFPPANPIFAISPTSWEYGQVQLGQSPAKLFTISNTGAGTLFIDKDAVSITGTNAAEFSLNPITEDISLTAGQSTQITVNFMPASIGAKSATLQIIDNIAEEKAGLKSGIKATQNVFLTGEGFDSSISGFPYTQNFDSVTAPAIPTGWTVINANADAKTWVTSTTYPKSAPNSLYLSYNSEEASDDYIFTPPAALTAGVKYRIAFYYRSSGSYPENLELMVGQTPTVSGLTSLLDLVEFENSAYERGTATYTPATTGNYYFAWHGYSDADQYFIALDDISIDFAYDYPADEPIVVGEDTITITGGSANNGSGEIPPVNNGAFVAAGSLILELIGAGPWTVTIETTAPWGAYYRGGNWTAVENMGGFIIFDIAASKDLPLPIILGDKDPTLPVTLSFFTAILNSDLQVQIAWIAESETDHAGYNIMRSEVKELATAMMINHGLIEDGQNVGTQIRYNYLDTEVYHDATYYYWLESVSLSGEAEYHGPIIVFINAEGEGPGIPEIPMETKLFSAFPNPFNPSTNLRYSMKEAGEVRIDVFNVKGQILKTFVNSHSLPGYYQVAWDGRDLNGRLAGTGVYFYRMSSGNYTSTQKMVLAK